MSVPGKGRRTALWCLFAALFFVVAQGQSAAQEEAGLQSLTLSLLPQYDNPRLMIVIEARLERPGRGAIAIPPGVELTGLDAWSDDGGYQPIDAAWDGASDGRFITFTSPTFVVRLVLYQAIVPEGPARDMMFAVPGQREPVERLEWRAYFPAGAGNLDSEPEMDRMGVEHLGMAGACQHGPWYRSG